MFLVGLEVVKEDVVMAQGNHEDQLCKAKPQ